MIDMTYWCESCARKNNCYTIRSRPKCFTPITNTAHGTPESYLAKALRYSQDSHEIAKTENCSEKPNNCEDEPQTDPLPKAINGVNISDAVAWADKWLEDNPVSEMWDMIRTLRDATEWQDEPQPNADQHTQDVENVGNTDCAWSEPNE